MKKFFAVLLVFASGFFLLEVVNEGLYLFTAHSENSTPKIILIEPGPFNKLSEKLVNEEIITDKKRFIWVARILRKTSKVRVGEYELRANMTPYQILSIITSGKSVLHAVSIPEGYCIEQIAEELAKKNLVRKEDFIKLAHDPRFAKYLGIEQKSLEGYLFPDTYSFTRFTGTKTILTTMVERFKEVYGREIKFGAERQSLDQHYIVTLASIVEKETGVGSERPLIASVFMNRLKIRMPLQSDPTVLYTMKDKKNIRRQDLIARTPYNTYVIRGLPPGPIASPGKDSMLAVIEPAKTKYLYFVSRNDGTHQFSETLQAHNSAVKRFQQDPRARQGKSWRDLGKKAPLMN